MISLSVPVDKIPFIRSIEGRKFRDGKWLFPESASETLIKYGLLDNEYKTKEKEYVKYDLSDFLYKHQKEAVNKALNENAEWFFGEIEKTVAEAGLPYQVNHVGSIGSLFFTGEKVRDYDSAKTSDTKAFAEYCNYMLNHGIYLAPAQFEAMFLSMAHSKEILEETLQTMKQYFL